MVDINLTPLIRAHISPYQHDDGSWRQPHGIWRDGFGTWHDAHGRWRDRAGYWHETHPEMERGPHFFDRMLNHVIEHHEAAEAKALAEKEQWDKDHQDGG